MTVRDPTTKTSTPRHYRERIGDVAELLLGYVEQKTTYQAEKILTIPASNYVDPVLWQSEIDAIFKRLPLMLALSCEMPNPGDYKAMDVVGLPVLIVRDKVGTVRAFLNVCSHRWSPVTAEGHGHCAHFRFVCPFHGWTFGADGKLMGVADSAKFGEIDRSTRGLKQLPCEERHGLIFVCLTPGSSLDLSLYYGALLEEFADVGLKDWAFLGSTVLEAPNWKLIFTNFFESYHFATQHAESVGKWFVSNVNHFEGFGPNMRAAFAKHEITKLREVPRAEWGHQEGPAFTFMRYLFPNVIGSLGLFDGSSSIGQIFPGPTPDRSRVVVLHVSKDAPKEGEEEKVIQELQAIDRQVLGAEDFATGILSQKGLNSGAHEGFLYGRCERGSQYFHEWVEWYLKGDPKLPKPVM